MLREEGDSDSSSELFLQSKCRRIIRQLLASSEDGNSSDKIAKNSDKDSSHCSDSSISNTGTIYRNECFSMQPVEYCASYEYPRCQNNAEVLKCNEVEDFYR